MYSYVLYLVMLAMQGQSAANPFDCGEMCTTTGTGALATVTTITTPMMSIHMTKGDPVILEVNSNGKHLNVMADGTVTGDLPHDAAADQFWKAVATIAPTDKCATGARP